MIQAVYPGSFDPLTNGHLDIIRRAAMLFETLYVAVYDRPSRNLLFPTATRVALVQEAVCDLPSVRVATYNGLTVEFAQSVGARVIVRGLRTGMDFDAESLMSQVNRRLAPGVETLLIMSDPEHAFYSASRVREVAALGGDIAWMVPPHVVEAVRQAYADRA